MENKFFKDKILDIKSLYSISDLDQVKELISSKPIHIIEYCLSLLENKDYSQLFEFAVENKDLLLNKSELATSIMKGNFEDTKKLIFLDLYCNTRFENINSDYFKRNTQSLREFLAYCQEVRKDVTLEMVNHFNKKRICDGLNREYFLELLNKSIDEPELMENLKIKLVKKLEQVLFNDYNCGQETVSDRINAFFEIYNTNYVGYNMQNLLHRLRISSNDIRHDETNGEDLSIDQLKLCIDYICAIDKDECFHVDNFNLEYKSFDGDY